MRPMRGIAAMALVASLAAGCSGDSTSATPTQSPSDVESESVRTPRPTPRPPTLPAAASEHTDRGAVAFASYFVEVLNYTAMSGDTRRLAAISTANCESCQNIIEITDSAYSRGGYIRGRGWRIKTFSVLKPGVDQMRIVTMSVWTAAQSYQRDSAAAAERIRAGKARVNLHVVPRQRFWTVTQMDVSI